jgi:RNA polymerase sigma-B factor
MARKALKFQLTAEQQKMVKENLNLARREAWRIQRTTQIEYSILEGVAFMGLCKACHRYDPSSGYKFSSLATPTIRGELLHWVRDKTYAMRLSHKMRENWVKGRKMLYKGMPDIEIAKELGITLESWQETRSACSGPPLELRDQAMPTDALEPDEMDFCTVYRELAAEVLSALTEQERSIISSYLHESGSRPSAKVVSSLMEKFMCNEIEGASMMF